MLKRDHRNARFPRVECFYSMYLTRKAIIAQKASRSVYQNGHTIGRLLLLPSTRIQTISCGQSQARDMVQARAHPSASGTVGLAKDTRTLSLDVVAAIGFHGSYKFHASTEPGLDEARNYRRSLAITFDDAIFMMLAPPKLLSMPFIPKSWARIGKATRNFKQYTMNMFDEERKLLDAGKSGTGNLKSSLVRASENEQANKKGSTHPHKGLTWMRFSVTLVLNFAGRHKYACIQHASDCSQPRSPRLGRRRASRGVARIKQRDMGLFGAVSTPQAMPSSPGKCTMFC